MIRTVIPQLRNICYFALLTFFASLTFSTALAEISFVIALVSWLLDRILQKRGIPNFKELRLPLVFFALYITGCFLSIFVSEVQSLSIRGFFKVLQQALIMIVVFDLFSSFTKPTSSVERFILCVLLFTSVNALIQYFFGFDVLRGFEPQHSGAGYRVSASFKSYGLLANYLIITIPFVFTLLLTQWKSIKWLKLVYVIAITFSCAALFLTRSRGAMLALFLSIILTLILNRRFKYLLIFFILAITGLFFVPREMIIHKSYFSKEQSFVERQYLWDRALQVIKAKPITGTGLNTYAKTHLNYDKTNDWRVRGYYAHNGYLQTTAEIGIPTTACLLASFVAFILAFIIQLKNQPPPVRLKGWGIITGLFSFLLFCMIDTVMHNNTAVMTFYFALGLMGLYLPIRDDKLRPSS